MKIAILGYGKMGKEIERIAISRGHEIVIKSDGNDMYDISIAHIAIDFSTPESAYNNILNCINNQIPVISGTTGWLKKYDDIVRVCEEKNGALIYASNFSLGVNIFFELNNHLAKMMNKLKDYKVSIEETHHIKKLDSPSGTAITLANGIIENSEFSDWELDKVTSEKNVPIFSKRISDVPGIHKVSYTSDIDKVQINHIAKNRQGFALGALIASEWLVNKKGVYTMKDVLNIV
ncbi:MAG: 4-hydroxy-tetrahydrodipicolinate reductase [Polaribacter sp. SA4-10]|nr:MAG: 4-hydroxy-tetrahydrodipicolinate reductase [Polaribacter sp. SA4-10]|tara:strand:+ start:777 stop:1478 length:702 start_codon:yes stop_codon:yes gene_type:complete